VCEREREREIGVQLIRLWPMAPSLARFREGVENKVIATRGAVEMTSLSNLTLPTPTTQDGRHTSGFQSHGAPAIIILVAAEPPLEHTPPLQPGRSFDPSVSPARPSFREQPSRADVGHGGFTCSGDLHGDTDATGTPSGTR